MRDRRTLARIRSLAIPPAWTDVWIGTRPNGHLQAVGRDARGRKQYRYHRRWRATRDAAKFDRMLAFARALGTIRRRVRADLRRPGLPREKVLATVVSLLERTFLRVGNDEYARANGSYGLTTIRNRHAKVRGGTVRLRFRGKGNRALEATVEDPRIARIVRACQSLPGQDLFGYVDEEGRARDVKSEDVNAYLREITGEDFTAKDFRTWAGTVLALLALQEAGPRATPAQARRAVVAAVARVAQRLGNTPAICRKCYVHPAVLDAYVDGEIAEAWGGRLANLNGSLPRLERFLVRLLRRRLQKAAAKPDARPGEIERAAAALSRPRPRARRLRRRVRPRASP